MVNNSGCLSTETLSASAIKILAASRYELLLLSGSDKSIAWSM